MANDILKQFGMIIPPGGYTFGSVSEVRKNSIYIINTSGGLKLTIQDFNITLEVDDPVLLAQSDNQTNTTFIIKKGSKSQPIATNFIVGNDLN